jgi:hypothetical protein
MERASARRAKQKAAVPPNWQRNCHEQQHNGRAYLSASAEIIKRARWPRDRERNTVTEEERGVREREKKKTVWASRVLFIGLEHKICYLCMWKIIRIGRSLIFSLRNKMRCLEWCRINYIAHKWASFGRSQLFLKIKISPLDAFIDTRIEYMS